MGFRECGSWLVDTRGLMSVAEADSLCETSVYTQAVPHNQFVLDRSLYCKCKSCRSLQEAIQRPRERKRAQRPSRSPERTKTINARGLIVAGFKLYVLIALYMIQQLSILHRH